MVFQRGVKTAKRDWQNRQEIGEAEYRALCDELGGEPEGDHILMPVGWPEGSEGAKATTTERWRVSGPD